MLRGVILEPRLAKVGPLERDPSVLTVEVHTSTYLVIADQSRVGFIQEERNGLLDLIHRSTRVPDISEGARVD